jgi:hypothetical protein
MTAHAGLNKWVDENGKMHYSDSPPANTKVESVRNVAGKGQESTAADPSPKNYVQREAELKKARLEKREATEKAKQENTQNEERKQNCALARENIRALESGVRLTTYDENGERRFMDDAEHAQRLNNAREAVRNNCD